MLAERLSGLAGQPDLLVLGLPRGGVPVAWEVARRLGAPLDVFVVRKLGFPGHEELAMGAIASGGVRVLNPEVIAYGVDQAEIERVAQRERAEPRGEEGLGDEGAGAAPGGGAQGGPHAQGPRVGRASAQRARAGRHPGTEYRDAERQAACWGSVLPG